VAVVVGYLVSVVVGILVLWAVVGRSFTVDRDPVVNLSELGGRHVGILSGLGGFAVTGMVLLVTLGRNLPDASSTAYTTVLMMFFISWMAYAGTAFLFANIVDAKGVSAGGRTPKFDVAAAQFAGAGATLEIAFANGWLAMRPLFQAFGLVRPYELAAPIVVVVAFASYGLVAYHLFRSGYGPTSAVVTIPLLAVGSALTYGVIAGAFGLRSEEATLDLIIAAFLVGALAFGLLNALALLARHERAELALDRYGRYLVLAYAQAVVMLLAFTVLGVLGLA